MRFLLTRRPEVDEFQDVVPDEFQVSMSLRASASAKHMCRQLLS